MIPVHDILGKLRFFRKCELDDVLTHWQKIAHWIPAGEELEFQARMGACVKAGTAYVMINSDTFLYYDKQDSHTAHGVALFGKDSPIDIMALFIGIFGFIDTKVFKMDFTLHPGKFATEYKSILTPESIRRSASIPGYPLVVRIDELKKKCIAIYKTRTGKCQG